MKRAMKRDPNVVVAVAEAPGIGKMANRVLVRNRLAPKKNETRNEIMPMKKRKMVFA
jgi:hypothetical protein